MNKTILNRILLALVVLLLAGCATEKLTIKPAGFKQGVGNGFVSPFAFIGKYIFGSRYAMYTDYNTGVGYWLGFILGVVIIIFLFRILFGILANID